MNTQKTVGGVQLEAVRLHLPRPHWRIKVVETGYVFESGVFGGARPLAKVWATVEDVARLRGDSWVNETLFWVPNTRSHPDQSAT
jgi:hypothetical protein